MGYASCWQRVSLKDIFPQRLKAAIDFASYGTAEAVPFQSKFKLTHYPFSDPITGKNQDLDQEFC